VWDSHSGMELKTLTGHTDWITALAISPDGKQIFTGGRNGQAIIWDAETFQQIRAFQAHTDEVANAAFSPDGASVATAGNDGSARLWDAHTGQLQRTLRGHLRGVRNVAFLPGGDLVTASDDATAKVWSLAAPDEVLTLGIDYSVLFSSGVVYNRHGVEHWSAH